jgi:hypothetical protein
MKIVDFLMRRVLGQLVNRGVKAGIDHAAGGGKPKAEMTQAERRQARQARQAVKRARQAARMSRRMMR